MRKIAEAYFSTTGSLRDSAWPRRRYLSPSQFKQLYIKHSQEVLPPGKYHPAVGLHSPLATQVLIPSQTKQSLKHIVGLSTGDWSMGGECLGWSKERSPSRGMKEQDLDLKDRGWQHQAVFTLSGPPISSGLTPVAFILHDLHHSMYLCSFYLLPTVVCFHFPFPDSYYFTFLPLLTIPNAKLTNVGKKTNFFLNSVDFFL